MKINETGSSKKMLVFKVLDVHECTSNIRLDFEIIFSIFNIAFMDIIILGFYMKVMKFLAINNHSL